MWLRDRKNRRSIPHRLEKCGYVPVHNGAAKDGLWTVNGKRQAIYRQKRAPIQREITGRVSEVSEIEDDDLGEK